LQRRGYASKAPVTILSQDADVTTPPDQSKYLKNPATYDETASKNLAYLLIGTYGFVQASAVKNIVSDLLVTLSASADVLAMAKVEVDLSAIPEGKNVVIKVWRLICLLPHSTLTFSRILIRWLLCVTYLRYYSGVESLFSSDTELLMVCLLVQTIKVAGG
jgi:hypothetical protein